MNQKGVIRSQTGKPSNKGNLSQVLTVPVQASLQAQFIKACPFLPSRFCMFFPRMLISSEKNNHPSPISTPARARANKKTFCRQKIFILYFQDVIIRYKTPRDQKEERPSLAAPL